MAEESGEKEIDEDHMFGWFGIFSNIADEKKLLKQFMIQHHISFLRLRDLFFTLQKDYRDTMVFKYQGEGIVYERDFEIRVLKVKDWSIERMVEDKYSFRQIVDTFLKKGDIILNRNIPSSHYPEYFL
jgi:hypothetical protein